MNNVSELFVAQSKRLCKQLNWENVNTEDAVKFFQTCLQSYRKHKPDSEWDDDTIICGWDTHSVALWYFMKDDDVDQQYTFEDLLMVRTIENMLKEEVVICIIVGDSIEEALDEWDI